MSTAENIEPIHDDIASVIAEARIARDARNDDESYARTVEHERALARRLGRRQRLEDSGVRVTEDDLEAIEHDTLTETKAVKTVKAWLDVARGKRTSEKRLKFLVLCGSIGTGKTVAAAYAIAESKVSSMYITAEQLRRGYCQETDEARALRNRMARVGLLVVDDLMTERNEFEGKLALQEVVNDRQGRCRWTLITGNFNKADFVKRYDARTLSRIEHQGVIATVDGESMRVK